MRKMTALTSVLALIAVALAGRSLAEDQTATASIGSKAPNFTLQDQNGKNVSLRDFAGKIVVLEWTNPQCPYVQRQYQEKTMTTLASDYAAKNVAWLAVNSSDFATNDSNLQWAVQQNIAYPILNDSNGTVGHAYGATNTPDMYVIGTDGTLLYQGAIDNDPEGDKGSEKVNYVKTALDEILSGKPVATPQTKPYGCGVKYKD